MNRVNPIDTTGSDASDNSTSGLNNNNISASQLLPANQGFRLNKVNVDNWAHFIVSVLLIVVLIISLFCFFHNVLIAYEEYKLIVTLENANFICYRLLESKDGLNEAAKCVNNHLLMWGGFILIKNIVLLGVIVASIKGISVFTGLRDTDINVGSFLELLNQISQKIIDKMK